MNARYLPLALLAVNLSGCATGRWVHPTMTQAQVQQAGWTCQLQGQQMAAGLWGPGTFGAVLDAEQFRQECLKANGFSYVKLAR